ncbi:unnamed protein product [Urochloa decumbens]|uniref:Bowman-Birk serine protease inhibitors family domain-containing protein n=1 Tax=Urochloa decumbens TaxID=240449 RepID=A0ABC9AHL2_9POAL
MGKRVASILPMLWLEALLLVAGLSAGSSGDDTGAIIRLPSATAASGEEGFADEAMMAAASARQRDNKERPWKCCDIQVCTMSAMASCWCHDLLEQCSKACKECGKVRGSNPPRYICKDMYRGDPAPRCSGGEDQGSRAVVHHVHGGLKEKAVIVRGSKEGNNGEERPWKCCDKAVITGPTTEGTVVWYCMDKVEHCTCDRCLELEGSRRYYCLDGYEGSDPGPSGTRAA